MTSTDRDDSWGLYRPGIESHLATCADYLDRLQRSVAGEIAPGRHYFHDKAHQLHEAIHVLVRRGEDIERWLLACDTTVESDEDGHMVVGTCERPSGHTGPHDGGPHREPSSSLPASPHPRRCRGGGKSAPRDRRPRRRSADACWRLGVR